MMKIASALPSLFLLLAGAACSEEGNDGDVNSQNILSQQQLETDAKHINEKADEIAKKAEDKVRIELTEKQGKETDQ